MPNQLLQDLLHYHVTEELDALYMRSLHGQDGRRVLRTFEEVFEREDHATQTVVKPLKDVSR
jgi:hypothetical protein